MLLFCVRTRCIPAPGLVTSLRRPARPLDEVLHEGGSSEGPPGVPRAWSSPHPCVSAPINRIRADDGVA